MERHHMRNGMAINPISSTSKFMVVLLMHTSQTVTERSWTVKLKSFDLLVIARILKVTDCTVNRPTK